VRAYDVQNVVQTEAQFLSVQLRRAGTRPGDTLVSSAEMR
jgi:hypothetical protein